MASETDISAGKQGHENHESNEQIVQNERMVQICEEAHIHSMLHREEIEASKICGCFFCMHIFSPEEIKEWIDVQHRQDPQTAICPKCGIDAVIGDRSGYEINFEFLYSMNSYWF